MTMQGTIAKVILDRGFGFIEVGGYDRLVFFHVGALPNGVPFDEQLLERRVEIETIETEKGPRATSVRPIR